MDRLFGALFLQWRIDDGSAETENECTSSRFFIATEPKSLDRYICVPSRDHRGRSIVRMVQSVRVKSLRQTEVQEFRVGIYLFFIFFFLGFSLYSYFQYAFSVVGDVGSALRRSGQLQSTEIMAKQVFD